MAGAECYGAFDRRPPAEASYSAAAARYPMPQGGSNIHPWVTQIKKRSGANSSKPTDAMPYSHFAIMARTTVHSVWPHSSGFGKSKRQASGMQRNGGDETRAKTIMSGLGRLNPIGWFYRLEP